MKQTLRGTCKYNLSQKLTSSYTFTAHTQSAPSLVNVISGIISESLKICRWYMVISITILILNFNGFFLWSPNCKGNYLRDIPKVFCSAYVMSIQHVISCCIFLLCITNYILHLWKDIYVNFSCRYSMNQASLECNFSEK